ncbi:uncharacterized protein LOC113318349 isoform X1 [Papaver somniferum]|uniref:uncharacterized protein LOC113318349 isoform X1 n=1 Tax=Papaver somniferum TaxID=3469 RepID=UPI000E70343F|nr:uncharacterized protein LOC113318349 isoform X1 [Papaver somniferum]XP_026422280.1 uncharacterized protein LOC113318349 isoform X1 [Papaver somniferum]
MVGNEEVKKEDEQIYEYDVPDPEFYDFFKDKKKECFEIDQMWAIYDEIDGMPRRYARIREVYSPGFKVRMTWLEPDPDDKGVKDWTEAELPVACGKFIRDRSDKSEDLEIFSHRLEWEKGDSYASYRIYPRKGETWAVFDNWDIKWSFEPKKHKDFQYKFVEVLSDYSEESGVLVSYLVKIQGFVSLFKPATRNDGNASLQIPPNEILRFSHRAPSHRTTGRERGDVPAGYFELDPASVPTCIEEIRDLDLNVPIECIDAKDGIPLIEDESHMANIRKTSGVSCTMQGENFKCGSGSPSLSNGCYEEKMSEENASHLLELTSSGSDSSNIKEIGLDPASLPSNFEETSNPVNLNLNSDIVDPDSPVSLGSLEEENPFFFKKRANPDEKSFLDEGNSEVRNGSPRLLNGCLEENADHPFGITPCGSGHAKSCNVSDTEAMGPDHTISSSNVEESCVHADEKALGEINNSSKSPAAGGRLLKRKKRKNHDVKGSPRLSNGCSKKKHCKETSAYAEKISSDSQQVESKLEIYPRKGEVWALCRSDTSKWPWSNSSTISDVDIVEVLEDNTEMIKVLVLKTVIASTKTVYKPKKRSGNDILAEIPRVELHKFSHKIPVRRRTMTGLQECWELDMREKFPVEDSIADESKGREAANESESIVGPKDIPDQEFLEFVDSDFNDFDLVRKEDCFAVGQVWASYDRIDGMPRGYARIEKVYSPGFMVEITTLKADLEEADEVGWIHEDLPITCGKFKHDITLIVDDRAAFSHRVEWELGMGTGSYRIYPRKGETWALFKNVDDIKRSSDPINTRNIRYEYVEILSDYSEELGVKVAYLVKIKGFVSLFMRTLCNSMNFIQITPDERMKFSHKVPSFRTTGKEREDVPEGYFELDPASLPSNLEVISESEDVQVNTKNVEAVTNDSSASPKEDSPCARKKRKTNPLNRNSRDAGNSRYGSLLPITPKRWCNKKKRSVLKRVGRSGSTFGNGNPLNLCRTVMNEIGSDGVVTNTDIVTVHRPVGLSEFVPCDIPDAENSNLKLGLPSSFQLNPEGIPEGQLYDFRDDKTHEKFQPGQVWAVYCDLDGLPKYYVQVKTVEVFPDFKVEVNWLQSCAPPEGLIRCNDVNMPLSCGMFETGETHTFDDTTYFFHHLTGVSNATENKFEIFPRKDEVWALYRNFSPSMSSSDLQKCEYDMVVVVEEQVHWMIVLVLQKFSSCMESVFMPKLKAGHLFHMAIPRCELLRFSHQVPAFRLSDDKYGSLRGSWVLDSESMPRCLISSN